MASVSYQGGRSMTDKLVTAEDFEAEPVDWLWEELIPCGMISLIAGRPDSGKSLFAVWLAAHLSRQGRNTMLSNREDPIPQVLIPRLNAVSALRKRITFWNPYLPRDTQELEKRIIQHNISCVIMDPAS